MKTLWLRPVDPVSRLVPRALLSQFRARPSELGGVCLIRPGGLGDLVLLTRAAKSLTIDLHQVALVIETRNAPWADFLSLPYLCYDNPPELLTLLSGRRQFNCVLNTEQTYGLSALLAKRLASPSGFVAGFNNNRRSDLYDRTVLYDQRTRHELECFSDLLTSARDLLPTGALVVPPARGRAGDAAVVAIGGRQARYKRLTLSQWVQLLRRAQRVSDRILLIGSRVDATFAAALVGAFSEGVENLVGQQSFADVVETIRAASRFFSVDSGLAHVADFFEVPSEVVFTSGLEAKWGPLCAGSITLRPSEL